MNRTFFSTNIFLYFTLAIFIFDVLNGEKAIVDDKIATRHINVANIFTKCVKYLVSNVR